MALNRTEEWRAAARAYAHRLGGLDPVRVPCVHLRGALTPAVQTSCTTMRLRPPPSSDFHLSARAVAAAVRELRGFVGSRRRDYCDPLRCSDTERAALECEVSDAVRDCRERIAGLTLAVPHAAADACGGGSPEGDVLAHHTGVVLILAERLAEAAGKFDRARAQRARLTLEAQSYRRRGATRPIEPVPAVSRHAQSVRDDGARPRVVASAETGNSRLRQRRRRNVHWHRRHRRCASRWRWMQRDMRLLRS